MLSELFKIIESLDLPAKGSTSGPQYYVKPIPKFERHYFGKTDSAVPCLLLRSDDETVRPPIRLTGLEIFYSIPCAIEDENAIEQVQNFTVVCCTSENPQLQEYFVYVCDIVLNIVGSSPSTVQIAEAMQHLIELFQKFSEPARRSVLGFIGELFVIYASNCPDIAIRAWRNGTDDRFDFSIEDIRLEVKSSSTRKRLHEFSLEQCEPPENTIGLLVSLFVEVSGGGLSLFELIKRIETRINSDYELMMEFQSTIAESLGRDLPSALSVRFDEDLAHSSLKFYSLHDIPAIRGDIPPQISHVRFQSDVTTVPTTNLTSNEHSSRALIAMFPRVT